MKHFIASLLLHISVFISLAFLNQNWTDMSADSPVVVNLIELPGSIVPEITQKNVKTILKKKKTKKKVTATAKNTLPSKLKEQTNESSEEVTQEGSDITDEELAAVKLSYTQELKFFLERNKKYPRPARRMRQSGIVKLKVNISQSGQFSNVVILSPAPFSSLNTAAVELFKKLGKFKPLPKDYKGNNEFIIPIAYKLNGRSSS